MATTGASHTKHEDEQAIRALVDKWMEATKTGDVDMVLPLMSDDVLFMVPGREPFGKNEFAAQSQQLSSVKVEGKSDIQEIEVLGDVAWMRNKLQVTMTKPGSEPSTRSGYTLTILRKQADGKWVIARDANLLS